MSEALYGWMIGRKWVEGSIITFQLTKEGGAKIIDAGVEKSQTFSSALLLDLFVLESLYSRT